MYMNRTPVSYHLASTLFFVLLDMSIIVTIFIVIFLSAFWIGTVIAALLRARLGKTARGRDIGR